MEFLSNLYPPVFVFRRGGLVVKRLIRKHSRPKLGERRSDPRIAGPFRASVSGIDAAGETFETEAAIDDLSANDFNLRLRRLVSPGDKLFVVAQVFEATIAMRGIVARCERENGDCQLTVAINRYRFLPRLKTS